MQLPPVGQISEDHHGEVTGYLSQLAMESNEARREWDPILDANLNIYTYGDENGPPSPSKIVINEIQNAVIAATDIQTKDPPQATLEPVETGEPPLYYWAGPPEATAPFVAMGLLQPFEVADWLDPQTGALEPPTSLDPLMAGQLKAVAVPEDAAPALPPGAIRPEWLVELDDKLIADTYQTVFDIFWERSQSDLFVRENLLDTNVQGFAWGLYEFDDAKLSHCLRHMPIPQVYIDPTVRDIADADYAGIELPLSAERATALYPAMADMIEAEAREGPLLSTDGSTQFSQVFQQSFRRRMVVFRVFWLRNQVVPMDKDEAAGLGLVEEVGYGGEQGTTNPPVPTSAGDVGVSPEEGALAAGDAGPIAEGDQARAHGLPAADSGGDEGACILVATGQPIQPGDVAAGWPTRIGIRQITQLGTQIVDDRECEFADIPILHNVNIPLPGLRPWGLGEPYRLKQIQMAESRLMTAMVKHADYFASPVVTISQSMFDALGKEYAKANVSPGMTLIVPDDQWLATKGVVQAIQDPPQTPPALAELFPMLKGLIQEQSGHSEVLQGRTGPSARSGTAIDLLQTAASSMIGFKAQRTGDMVKRLAKLMLHSIVWRLDVDDIERIVSRYPRHVLEAIHQRARQMDWNVKVVVQAGNGGLQLQKRQMAQMDLQVGALSMEGYREKAGIDHRLEDQRIKSEMQKRAALGMTEPGQEAGQEKKQGPPNNPA